MREWGKRRRERGEIMRDSEHGNKRPRVERDENAGKSTGEPWEVDKAQREQWRKSSKPLLDKGEGKKEGLTRNGKLERPARKTQQVVSCAPSGKSQKERVAEERQRRIVTLQTRREPKQTPVPPGEGSVLAPVDEEVAPAGRVMLPAGR